MVDFDQSVSYTPVTSTGESDRALPAAPVCRGTGRGRLWQTWRLQTISVSIVLTDEPSAAGDKAAHPALARFLCLPDDMHNSGEIVIEDHLSAGNKADVMTIQINKCREDPSLKHAAIVQTAS